jgi:hypothetical protein
VLLLEKKLLECLLTKNDLSNLALAVEINTALKQEYKTRGTVCHEVYLTKFLCKLYHVAT